MIRMEIKAEVHTVHPSSASSGVSSKTAGGRAYGSWCTPEDTPPPHARLSRTDSKNEAKAQIREETNQKKQTSIQPQSDLPFSRPASSLNLKAEKESPIELNEIEGSNVKNDDVNVQPHQQNETDEITVESPQSPVPKSPSREKKCNGVFRLPAFCDPMLPIDPQGRAYITWLLLVTCCYSYNSWCIALRVTFPYQTPQNTPYWMVADYFCDLIYLIDLVVVKPRLMFLSEGFWVEGDGETRKNYRRKLQYKFDIISLLPLDLLYFYFGPQKVILRLPRLLKLQTFWEFHEAMDQVLSNPYAVRIGKTLFYIFYLIHLNACAYYAMSDYEGLASNGWVYDNEGNAYIRCFYFATKTATSIGKNPKPENALEYLFMTAAWLMGVFVFALLIGQIRDIIATATRARAEYRTSSDGCTRYLRKLNMPVALQRRVVDWLHFTWSQQRCFDESKILNSLPYNMKRDVALAVHMTTLSKVQLFKNCSDSLLRDLVLQLRPVSFLPGDIVVRCGDVGHQMYIIKSGECCVMSQDERNILATLREGSVFGEISLLGIDGLRRRTATVRSRGYSSLFALSRMDLDAALRHHKEAAHTLRLRADHMIRENAARRAEQRIAERQARKSGSTAESASMAARGRRLSSVSSADSALADKRLRTASSLAERRKLSVLSENQPQPCSASLASACSGVRTPVPTIVLSRE